ncbi:hypothetical protein Tco_0819184 [Tanacetum coccineum]|uniref:Uncharacterized protein n=1 Tax=Tanacetum coccineum TaxID=301880 RepID=A0ABQ5A5T6_9ASTR
MASHRLKPLFSIKECMTCGSLYTRECCSIGSLENKILVPEPESSPCCAKCETPVDGPYCRGCDLLQKNFEEHLLTYCVENENFQDFQDTSESSNDNTNGINAPRDPFVVNQDLGVNEVQKKEQAYEEEKYHAARRRMLSIPFVDEDDYIPLGDIIARYSTSKTITPDLPIEEPFKLSNFEEVNDVEQEEEKFDLEDIFQIQDVILREKLLNVHRLISNIESLKVNPTPDFVLKSPSTFPIPVVDSDAFFEESDISLSHLDNSLPEFEDF